MDNNNYFDPNHSFRSLFYPRVTPILSSELNELQKILEQKIDNFVKDSGVTGVLATPTYTISGGVLTLTSDVNVYIDGEKIHIPSGTTVSVSNMASGDTAILFVEKWDELVTKDSTLTNYGGEGLATVTNEIKPAYSPEVNNVSQRIANKWRLRVEKIAVGTTYTYSNAKYPYLGYTSSSVFSNMYVKGAKSSITKPATVTGVEVFRPANGSYKKYSDDVNLWVGGDVTDACKTTYGTVDGLVYAMPLLRLSLSGTTFTGAVEGTSEGIRKMNEQIADIYTTKATVASPAFTGTPTAPTPATSDNSTKLSTTAYVRTLLGAMDGNLTFTDSGTAFRGIQGTMAGSDLWRVGGAGISSDGGYLEIATTDNGTEPIYVRQYSGSTAFTTIVRTLTLLDGKGDTNIPGNLTVVGAITGNASSATKLATARAFTFSGDATGTSANFDGTGNVNTVLTLANSGVTAGTYFKTTVDAKGRVTSGSNPTTLAGFGITDATPFATMTGTTPATAGWYRIAQSAVNIGQNGGLFKVDFSGAGVIGSTLLRASCNNGVDSGTGVNQLSFSTSNGSLGLNQVRIVYNTTPTGNYAYLEVYNPTALAITYVVDLVDATGWTLTAPSTVGSIPSGYTSKSMGLDAGFISGDDVLATKQLKSNIATGTAPIVVQSTTMVNNLNAQYLNGQLGSYYAPVASPNFTGTPTAPTAGAGTNSTQLATTAFVATAIANLIGGSQASLDTLKELASALGNDPNFATTISNQIGLKAPLASPVFTGTVTIPTLAMGGDIYSSNGGERRFKTDNSTANWGYYVNSNSFGGYDWVNNRSIFVYTASANSLQMMGNGGSVSTKNNTLDNGSGNMSVSGTLTVAGTITGALNGNALSATSAITATNLAGGSAGSIPYQTGAGATAQLSAGTAGQVLTSNGAGAPAWKSLDMTFLAGTPLKEACKVATTANITLSGTQTIDGVAVVAGDRVLVKNQTTASQNGIYTVATGAWARTSDADTASKVAGGIVTVDSGATNGGGFFTCYIKGTDTVGTTSMPWYSVGDSSKKLNFFSATTSAELAGVISDETGSGSLVFANSPTFTGTVNMATLSVAGATTMTGLLTLKSGINLDNENTATINAVLVGVGTAGNYFSGSVVGSTIIRNETNADILIGFKGASGNETPALKLVYNATGSSKVLTQRNILDDGVGNAIVSGTLTVKNNSSGVATIVFPAQSNDAGFISHIEGTQNVGEMRFSVSDDSDDTDMFTWGATPSGTWKEGARLTSAGSLTVQGNINLGKVLNIGTNSYNKSTISFFDPNYDTWQEYMAPAGAGKDINGGTAPSYGSVTNWARRSLIENSAGYGWIWESTKDKTSNSGTATDATPMMSLDSTNGNLAVKGNITLGGVIYGTTTNFHIVPSGGGQVGFVNNARTKWGLAVADNASGNPTAKTYNNTLDDGSGNLIVGNRKVWLLNFDYTTAGGTPVMVGNWSSGGLWGIGTDSNGSSDYTLKIGKVNSSSLAWDNSNGASVHVSGKVIADAGVSVANKFTMQYNSTEDSMDFIYG